MRTEDILTLLAIPLGGLIAAWILWFFLFRNDDKEQPTQETHDEHR